MYASAPSSSLVKDGPHPTIPLAGPQVTSAALRTLTQRRKLLRRARSFIRWRSSRWQSEDDGATRNL